MAVCFVPPYKDRMRLAKMFDHGFVEPGAQLVHPDLIFGKKVFIGDGVILCERKNGGAINLGDHVCIYKNAIIETGQNATVAVGEHSSIHPYCHVSAYVEPISIGKGVMIAPNCMIYSHNHGIRAVQPIRHQPLTSNGPVIIGDEAWVGGHSIILSGVRIGDGAVIGAGSVVSKDVPAGAVAAGNPAQVRKMRE